MDSGRYLCLKQRTWSGTENKDQKSCDESSELARSSATGGILARLVEKFF
jgi:hypothetical protein